MGTHDSSANRAVQGGAANPSHLTNAELPPLGAGSNLIGKVLSVLTQPPAAYRSAVTAADVLAAPTVGTTSVVSGGSLSNGQAYNSKVVAGNAYGRTTATAGPWTGALSNASCVIGAGNLVPANVWQGYAAHVAIWSTALTPGEVAALGGAHG